MECEYRCNSLNRLRLGRLLLIFIGSIALCIPSFVVLMRRNKSSIAAVVPSPKLSADWQYMLDAQKECLQYDGKREVVYAATRQLPKEVTFENYGVNPTATETICMPRPGCWCDLTGCLTGPSQPCPPFNTFGPITPGPILALHKRAVGGRHYLLFLQFNTYYPNLEAELITPATRAAPADTDPLPIKAAYTNRALDPFYGNGWESIVIHAAVMDPVDQTHFTIEMVVDGTSVVGHFYLVQDASDSKFHLLLDDHKVAK